MPRLKIKRNGLTTDVNTHEMRGSTNVTSVKNLTQMSGASVVTVLNSILNDPSIGEPLKIMRDQAQKFPWMVFDITQE